MNVFFYSPAVQACPPCDLTIGSQCFIQVAAIVPDKVFGTDTTLLHLIDKLGRSTIASVGKVSGITSF